MWMLLHGFTGSSRSWEAVCAAADFDQDPLCPALVGHGSHWRDTEVGSFEEEASRLVSIASDLRGPRFLCGYSMGARVALGMLAAAPELFDAAVLIGVHPGLSNESARTERRDVDADRMRLLRERGLPAFIEAWEDQPLFASQSDLARGVLEVQREIRLSHDAEGLARALEVLGLAGMPDYHVAVSSLGIPVVLMAGARDTKFAAIARALASEHPLLHADIVSGAGHNLLLEAPSVVASALSRAEREARARLS